MTDCVLCKESCVGFSLVNQPCEQVGLSIVAIFKLITVTDWIVWLSGENQNNFPESLAKRALNFQKWSEILFLITCLSNENTKDTLEVLNVYMRMWSMFVHYDFMKKGFQGALLRVVPKNCSFECKNLLCCGKLKKEAHHLGHCSDVFCKYTYMFCLNAYMRLSVCLQGKGVEILV